MVEFRQVRMLDAKLAPRRHHRSPSLLNQFDAGIVVDFARDKSL